MSDFTYAATEANGGSTPVSPLKRAVFLPLGVLSLGVGIVGLVTPMVPGAVFLIAAAWLFARSSPRFERWMLSHATYGPIVRGWREKGAVPPWVKAIALASFVLSFSLAFAGGAPLWALAVIATSFVAVGAYLLTRPSA